MLQTSLIGPEGTGKSSLYRLLSGEEPRETMLTESFSPPTAMLELPDARLDALAAMLPGRKVVQLVVELFDFPGFGKGTPVRLLNRLLPHVRQSDLLVVVVRAGANAEATAAAYRAFRDELVLLDYATAENALANLRSKLKAVRKPEEDPRYRLLARVVELLEAGGSLYAELAPADKEELKDLALLTLKPTLAVVNLGEEEYADTGLRAAVCRRVGESAGVTACHALPVALAAELSELPEDERAEFRQLYGIEGPLLPPLQKALLTALDHIAFFTFNEKELRAWSVPAGSTAVQAAGVIHSDLARGFIRAEVIGAEELASLGSMEAAKSMGKLRSEGKEYRIQDGEVMLVRFSV